MPWSHRHIVWFDIVPTPDAQTKEPVQASRGQMTNTPKPWPDIIPPTSRQTPQQTHSRGGLIQSILGRWRRPGTEGLSPLGCPNHLRQPLQRQTPAQSPSRLQTPLHPLTHDPDTSKSAYKGGQPWSGEADQNEQPPPPGSCSLIVHLLGPN